MRNPIRISEHDHQVSVITWASVMRGQYPELDFLHAIPNGAKLPWSKNKRGQRFSPEAEKLIAEGLKPGVSDLCLPVPKAIYHGLYIEMKAVDGEPTSDQVSFLEFVTSQGYFGCVCKGSILATNVLQWYLDLPPFGQEVTVPIPDNVLTFAVHTVDL